MFYIGVNQAVHPPTGELDGNAIFAIICVYLFVVFYSFGWGPIPFVLSSECAPNHVRSLIMAVALMTQWLFNFVIAKITPLMLADITYGTFLLFGSCCIIMGIYAIFFVPETKGLTLEQVDKMMAATTPRTSRHWKPTTTFAAEVHLAEKHLEIPVGTENVAPKV